MINKKNVLGKEPAELGLKDAIHTAIVSVRAGCAIKLGERCGPNKDREFVPDSKGPGIADPFRKGTITRGQVFWLLLDQDAVPTVHHVWEHPECDFTPPTKEASQNRTIAETAKDFGVTYQQMMDAADYVVKHDTAAMYPGSLTSDELKSVKFARWDFWSEWADETGFEFENEGSACCPEPCYPECKMFERIDS